MFPDDPPPIGLDGLSGEVYRDLKTMGRWFLDGVAEPFKHHLDAHRALAAFNPDFPSHGVEVTALVDYSKWHESDKDWRSGNGLLASATYGELPHLWTRPERFARYEARLHRFARAGGDMRRIFVIHHDLADNASRLSLYRTLIRHQALGFKPHILGVTDLEDAAAAAGVRSDVLGCFNGGIAYFLQSHDEMHPTMVRTIDPVTTYKVNSVLAQLWRESSTADEFFARHHIEVPDELKQQIQRNIDTVEELAYQRPEQ